MNVSVSSSCMTMPLLILLSDVKNCSKRSSGKSGDLPPYSSDLAPNDSFLFPKFKEHLAGTRFSSDTDVKTAAENCLNGQGRDFYQAGLNKLVLRSDKYLNRFVDNVEQ
ncbi:hypothetical protein AVEN_85025-1 [Araneus ventricosus]|uniref:Uncharacterized protein n=1 Tax=Araneus ventricosus TaxID=182803 RepID=A0A4Y2P246_ARAVE|nr:hypothetical protein AVEN_85025-1 [Araneus ventricosus]